PSKQQRLERVNFAVQQDADFSLPKLDIAVESPAAVAVSSWHSTASEAASCWATSAGTAVACRSPSIGSSAISTSTTRSAASRRRAGRPADLCNSRNRKYTLHCLRCARPAGEAHSSSRASRQQARVQSSPRVAAASGLPGRNCRAGGRRDMSSSSMESCEFGRQLGWAAPRTPCPATNLRASQRGGQRHHKSAGGVAQARVQVGAEAEVLQQAVQVAATVRRKGRRGQCGGSQTACQAAEGARLGGQAAPGERQLGKVAAAAVEARDADGVGQPERERAEDSLPPSESTQDPQSGLAESGSSPVNHVAALLFSPQPGHEGFGQFGLPTQIEQRPAGQIRLGAIGVQQQPHQLGDIGRGLARIRGRQQPHRPASIARAGQIDEALQCPGTARPLIERSRERVAVGPFVAACIDNKLELVRFLCEHGADLHARDKEGWTPLHATALGGHTEIAKYLIKRGASLTSANSDGDLPVDVAEQSEMRNLLRTGLPDVEEAAARNAEAAAMLADAIEWRRAGRYRDLRDPVANAGPLHVAAAKGYQQALAELLLCPGVPLEANQTVFDLADESVKPLLEELKVKQREIMQEKVMKRPAPVISTLKVEEGRAHSMRRSSVTRLPQSERHDLTLKGAEQEKHPEKLLQGNAVAPATTQSAGLPTAAAATSAVAPPGRSPLASSESLSSDDELRKSTAEARQQLQQRRPTPSPPGFVITTTSESPPPPSQPPPPLPASQSPAPTSVASSSSPASGVVSAKRRIEIIPAGSAAAPSAPDSATEAQTSRSKVRATPVQTVPEDVSDQQ
uniref:ANK_REP_REGION domain-containing protein n=1 Tax=Macrostomum lignano TaxID=282301 RepID=A0A1I8IVU2_9PLAT